MLTTLIHRILPLIALLAIAAPVMGQFSTGTPGAGHQQTKRLSAELILYEGKAAPGQAATLGVLLEIQENWKIQAGKGSGDEIPPYIATEVDLELPDGWLSNLPLWPKAKSFTLGDDEWAETLAVYEGRIVIIVPLLVPEDAELGRHELTASIRYQACDDAQCEIPTTTRAHLTIEVVDSIDPVAAPDLDEDVAQLFQEVMARHEGAPAAPSPPQETDAATAPIPAETAPTIGRPTFFGFSLPQFDGWFGLFMLALFAAIGGFILNLTPCVLPVIPIKIMTIIQHANHPGKNLVLGLWMFLGVVAFWVTLGLPVAFVADITDPSRIFGIWWLTLGIGVIIALMAFGMMGLFSIQLPGAVYAINPKADTAWGSFVFGIMTGVLGLPCFGFVAGALLVGAATMPASHVMIIFTALGLGMALPYLVLSLKPSWVERIPRTGPASELVKQVMGLLLLAAAAFFIGSGLIALVRGMPYIADQLHWWAVAFFAVLAGLWLIVRTFQISSSAVPRVAFLLIGLLVGGVAVLYAAASTATSRANYQAHQAALAASGGGAAAYVHGAWNRWTPVAFEQAQADGHVLVLDFTAEWCLNCKALKATVLDRDPVRSLLNSDDVVKFTVDLTSTRDAGWEFLRDLGQTGIPLLAIYTPGSDEPWQANAYTPQQVVDALETARAKRLAQR